MPMHVRSHSLIGAPVLLAASGSMPVTPASAAETLRVGKAVPEAFSFVPLDVGMRKGLFAKQGLEIESIAFNGDARMQQAMASDSLDIALGSGPAMAFIVKGAPVKAVAGMAGAPLLLAIVVRPDGPQTTAELKGNHQRIDRRLAHLLAGERDLPAAGLGAQGHRDRAHGRTGGTDRGHETR